MFVQLGGGLREYLGSRALRLLLMICDSHEKLKERNNAGWGEREEN